MVCVQNFTLHIEVHNLILEQREHTTKDSCIMSRNFLV